MAKPLERAQARELRKQGLSIIKIAEQVGVTKGTVSVWCSDISLTSEQIEKLQSNSRDGATKGQLRASEARRKERKERQDRYQNIGKERIGEISDRELMIIGAALYWAEGGKTGRVVAFANSDPNMMLLYVRWITKCMKVPLLKLKFGLHIHEDLDEEVEKKFWKDTLGIHECKFYKTQIKKNPLTGHRKKKEYHGTLQCFYNDTNLFYQIEGMIKQLCAHSLMDKTEDF